MRHYIKQNQQFVTQAEMGLVTAKVSDTSVQMAGLTDWKNQAEQNIDIYQQVTASIYVILLPLL